MQIGDRCWFTKSMRVVDVVEVLENGYIVEAVDVRKRLFATENGLRLIRNSTPTPADARTLRRALKESRRWAAVWKRAAKENRARAETAEECARIAEGYLGDTVFAMAENEPVTICREIAAAIRARFGGETGSD